MQIKAVFALLFGLFTACMPGISYAGSTDESPRTEYGLVASVISNCDEGIVATPVSVAQDLPVALRAPSVADKFSLSGCLFHASTAGNPTVYNNFGRASLPGLSFPLYLFHSVLLI
ncbi:MAG TPA: hypothetical protein VK154_17735 [Chitinophagales bacterium]|nr:hypothetical protein [Chitinophagales bacterium]